LHLELQLQRDELQQHKHHFELVFVKNNPLFEVEIDTHKFPTSDQMSEPKLNSDEVPIPRANFHSYVEI